MRIEVDVDLYYKVQGSCDLLLQIEAARMPDQRLVSDDLNLIAPNSYRAVMSDEGIGKRIWLTASEVFECRYNAQIKIERESSELATRAKVPLTELPGDVIKFLMGSRYCQPEQFYEFVNQTFAQQIGGAKITAMRDWIEQSFTYDPMASLPDTNASDSFAARRGVCRDYAHVLIAMARAVGIPARIVSTYAPEVDPQDFHAVAEVYLDHAWHLVDPTGMAQPGEIVRIGVGRDAADVAFMTFYGNMELKRQVIQVRRL